MTRHYTNYSLLSHNTFGIAVNATDFYEYETEEELLSLIREGRLGHRLLHIGAGSNLLFTEDFVGTVLHSGIRGREIVEENEERVLLRVGAGETWDDVVAWTLSQGWSGAENLSLIPGEVGASAVQNIGAYGVEAKDLIVKVETVNLATGERRVFEQEACEYSYRSSVFKHSLRGKYAVTHVVYHLSKTFTPHLEYGHLCESLPANGATITPAEVREVIISMRHRKLPDPREIGNAGSFFVNPMVGRATYDVLQQTYPDMPYYAMPDGRVKIPAGWLIEQCGWKGRSLGAAGVYARQALVLVNHGGATGQDILRLCKAVQQSVWQKFHIEIHPEVNVI